MTPQAGARRLLRATYLAVSIAVASVLSTLVWSWGHASWKWSGSPEGARNTALATFGLVTLVCLLGVSRQLTRKVRVAAFTLPVVFPGCASCLTAASDFNPGGGTNFMFANNTPDNGSPGLMLLLLGAALVGFSALVPLRSAALAEKPDEMPKVWSLAGSWVLAATLATALLAGAVPLQLGRWLLPHLTFGACLLLVGAALAKPHLRSVVLIAGGILIAIAAGLGYLSRYTTVARCEHASPGLVMHANATTTRDYRAPGVTLERVVCKTSFQYSDQTTNILLGRASDGRELRGKELFSHIAGTPLERARAARELLVPDECDGVVLPGSDVTQLWSGAPVQAPYESDGKLIFFGYKDDHMYGYGTSVGVIREPVRCTVNLHDLVTSVERSH